MINSRLTERVSISVITFLFAVLAFWLPCQGADIKNREIDPKVGQIEPADWVSEQTRVCFGIDILRDTKDGLEAQLNEVAEYGATVAEGAIYDGRNKKSSNGSWHFSNLQPRIPEARHKSRWSGPDAVERVVHTAPS